MQNRPEENIAHGIIINMTPMTPSLRLDRNGRIQYPSGNKLVWERDYQGSGKGFFFDYYTSGRPTRLNDLLKYGQWIFVPVESGFRAIIREDGVVYDEPEIQLNIPKLERSELEILAALHEVGHAKFWNTVHQAVSNNDNRILRLTGTFGQQLVEVK